jgi:hypothetical protein
LNISATSKIGHNECLPAYATHLMVIKDNYKVPAIMYGALQSSLTNANCINSTQNHSQNAVAEFSKKEKKKKEGDARQMAEKRVVSLIFNFEVH